MISRRSLLAGVGAGAGMVLVGGMGRSAHAAEVLKVASWAPQASSWGQLLQKLASTLKKSSRGAIVLDIQHNGAAGQEQAVLARLKSGSLDGAMVTGIGLADLHPPLGALHLPGLWPSWAALDGARDAMKATFEAEALLAQVVGAGWVDLGVVRRLSRAPIRLPEDVRGRGSACLSGDRIGDAIFRALGSTPHSLSMADMALQINTGAVDVIDVPCLFSKQLSWSRSFNHLQEDPVGHAFGGILFSAARLEALSSSHRQLLLETSQTLTAAFLKQVRAEDDAAFSQMKREMTVVSQTPEEKAVWAARYAEIRQGMSSRYGADLIAQLEGALPPG